MNSVSVFITTLGRPTLTDMLNSLVDELHDVDYLYIGIDGREHFDKVNNILQPFYSRFKCTIIPLYLQYNLGSWGHKLINQFKDTLKGDYIMFADDDDIYIKGSFEKIRRVMNIINKDRVALFKFYNNYATKDVVWKDPVLRVGNVGKVSGLIPNVPDKLGELGYHYEGDFEFYKNCKIPHIFCDEIIYCVKPRQTGYPI